MTNDRKTLLRRLAIFAGVAAVVGFLVPSMWEGVESLQGIPDGRHWGLFVAALMLSVLSRPINALGWRKILQGFGYNISRGAAVRIWVLGEACRWLPGGVWHFGSRTVQTVAVGIPVLVAVASLALELLLTVIASLLLAAVGLVLFGSEFLGRQSGSSFHGASVLAMVMVGAAIFGGLTLLASRYFFPKRLARIREKIVALKHVRLDWLTAIRCSVFYTLLMLLNGWAFYLTARAISPDMSLPFLAAVAINGVAWFIGLIAVMAPAGIGVRDGVLALQLSVWMPAGEAVMISLLWRVVLLVAELVCVLIVWGYPLAKRRLPFEFVRRAVRRGYVHGKTEGQESVAVKECRPLECQTFGCRVPATCASARVPQRELPQVINSER